VGTLTLGIEEGILIGVAASLVGFFIAATRPNMVELGRLPHLPAYRDLKYHPEAKTYPGVLITRLDGQLFFANVSFVKDRLVEFEARSKDEVRAVIIDASGISALDSTAAAALGEIARAYVDRGVRFMLSNVKAPVREVMERAGLHEIFGADCQFETVEEAVEDALSK
jgi:sulfate permease, SulP family